MVIRIKSINQFKKVLVILLFTTVSIFVSFLFFHSIFDIYNLSNNVIVNIAILISIFCLVIIYIIQGTGLSFVYGAYFILAHLGWVITVAYFGEIEPHWFSPNYFYDVISMVGISIYTFLFGVLTISLFIKKKKKDKNIKIEHKGDQILFRTGFVFSIYYTIILILGILTGNINPLGTYDEFRNATFPGLEWGDFFFRIGIAICFATANKRQLLLFSIFLLIPSSIVFLAGSRGEVIYPLAAGIAILLVRGFRFKSKHIFIFCLLFFLIIPLIAQTRGAPLSEVTFEEVNLQFTEPIREAGAAVRPFVVTYGWFEAGEEHAYGMTYLLPFRNVLGYLPNVESFEYSGSRYNIGERTPALGYSILAEFYFNFGLLGIIFLPIFIGTLISYFELRFKTSQQLVFGGVLFAILLHNVRGTFAVLPYRITIVVVLICIYIIIKQYKKNSAA